MLALSLSLSLSLAISLFSCFGKLPRSCKRSPRGGYWLALFSFFVVAAVAVIARRVVAVCCRFSYSSPLYIIPNSPQSPFPHSLLRLLRCRLFVVLRVVARFDPEALQPEVIPLPDDGTLILDPLLHANKPFIEPLQEAYSNYEGPYTRPL